MLARKPLSEPTVAANVLRWGTGAINVDACRVEYATDGDVVPASRHNITIGGSGIYGGGVAAITRGHPAGRWPANVILSHSLFCTDDACDPACPVALLDAQSGERKSGNPTGTYGTYQQAGVNAVYGAGLSSAVPNTPPYGDTGGASRFYATFRYQPKASRAERNAGLECTSTHPTVKPLALMQWLIRLVTPPGGVVLDPFLGSGTTALAALVEGMSCIGIEQDAEYIEIARRRIAHALRTKDAM